MRKKILWSLGVFLILALIGFGIHKGGNYYQLSYPSTNHAKIVEINNQYYAIATFPENKQKQIQIGQSASVQIAQFPDIFFEGSVDHINPNHSVAVLLRATPQLHDFAPSSMANVTVNTQ